MFKRMFFAHFAGLILIMPVVAKAARPGGQGQRLNIEVVGVLVLIVVFLGAIWLCSRIISELGSVMGKNKNKSE